MPINMTALEAAARKVAMARLEKGIHVASDVLVDLLKKTVDGSGGMQRRTRKKPTFLYRQDEGKGSEWERNPTQWDGAIRIRDIAPGKRSGDGQRAICYRILSRDEAKGEIRVLIGTNALAQGGINMPGGYMMAWEAGIRVREPGDPIKGKRSGPVIQRPWLRTTFDRYFDTYKAVVASVMQAP